MGRRVGILLGFAVMSSLCGQALAATTTVANAGSYDGANLTLDYVLGQAYGYTGQGTGTLSSSLSWTSGPNNITFTRVGDSGGVSPLSLNGSNFAIGNDDVWTDGTPVFRVNVRYASFGQTLGWYNNVTNTSQDILSVTSQGLNPSYTVLNIPAQLSTSFNWYDTYDTGTGTGTWYSDPTRNGGNGDHMVTYWVTGKDASGGLINNGLGAYVIAFEDLSLATSGSSDRDYNDLVVEVAQVIPVPAAVWSGLATLGAMGAWKVLRRRASRV